MLKPSLALTLALAAALGPLAPAFAETTPTEKAPRTAPEAPMSNQDWWPERLNLAPLRQQAAESDPMGPKFAYARAFATLDVNAVKADIRKVMNTSQDWWPADYGSYGPFFIRMAWHAAGTYRSMDGRGGADGGQQRFEPLNSWPDNVNLDKARRLLWPVKKKYGAKLSWADLMVLTGNVALESMGFKTFGFAGGRPDQYEPDMTYWGPEREWMGSNRTTPDRKLQKPLAAFHMGLIYVNPEGPDGKPDPVAAARDIREAFGRMAMNDEETIALIAGGHTFGKAHGAHPSAKLGAAPAGAPTEAQGFGWKNEAASGKGKDTTTSGLEGAWTASPTRWTTQYFDNLFGFDWVVTKSPAGAWQWVPANGQASNMVPDAHVPGLRHAPIMLTTDLALKMDPSYRAISKRFHDDPKQFELAFAKAWFKLTHRDMGPRWRYTGKDVPREVLLWQDPIPAPVGKPIDAKDVATLKARILASGLSSSALVKAAWASASTFRDTDMRGGANGGRIRLEPQRGWKANDPGELQGTLSRLETIRAAFNKPGAKHVSMADMVVLGGAAAIERAAKAGGHPVTVPFKPGRADASQAQTDVTTFQYLEPTADGFRNYYGEGNRLSPAAALVDRADTLSLTVPETTVLLGGLRVLGATSGNSRNGVLTTRPGTLGNDFFVNLLDMSTQWSKSSTEGLYEGRDRKTGAKRWTATPVDLIFGSNSELRAVAEVYAADDAKGKFVKDFVAAWSKVMEADRP